MNGKPPVARHCTTCLIRPSRLELTAHFVLTSITIMSTDPDALADELSGIITALESTPDNVGLLRREIAIMRELEMTPEALDTTLRLSALVMVEERE